MVPFERAASRECAGTTCVRFWAVKKQYFRYSSPIKRFWKLQISQSRDIPPRSIVRYLWLDQMTVDYSSLGPYILPFKRAAWKCWLHLKVAASVWHPWRHLRVSCLKSCRDCPTNKSTRTSYCHWRVLLARGEMPTRTYHGCDDNHQKVDMAFWGCCSSFIDFQGLASKG